MQRGAISLRETDLPCDARKLTLDVMMRLRARALDVFLAASVRRE
jgi:hypothetical protein